MDEDKPAKPYKVLVECGMKVYCNNCKHCGNKGWINDGVKGKRWCQKKFIKQRSNMERYLEGAEFTGLKEVIDPGNYDSKPKSSLNGDGHCKHFEPSFGFRFKQLRIRLWSRK